MSGATENDTDSKKVRRKAHDVRLNITGKDMYTQWLGICNKWRAKKKLQPYKEGKYFQINFTKACKREEVPKEEFYEAIQAVKANKGT